MDRFCLIHPCDGRTDRRTDRRTELRWLSNMGRLWGKLDNALHCHNSSNSVQGKQLTPTEMYKSAVLNATIQNVSKHDLAPDTDCAQLIDSSSAIGIYTLQLQLHIYSRKYDVNSCSAAACA